MWIYLDKRALLINMKDVKACYCEHDGSSNRYTLVACDGSDKIILLGTYENLEDAKSDLKMIVNSIGLKRNIVVLEQ